MYKQELQKIFNWTKNSNSYLRIWLWDPVGLKLQNKKTLNRNMSGHLVNFFPTMLYVAH